MSGWKEVEVGSVKMKHWSTSSLIEITIETEDETVQGVVENVLQTVWMDYATFSDLRNAINQTEMPKEESIVADREDETLCHICGSRTEWECRDCGQPVCDKCVVSYNQFTQIDYTLCKKCECNGQD